MLRKGTFIPMKTKIQDMTSGSPGRLIILFAIPLMLGNICQQLYTMVDTMVVGQVAGVEALAALGAVDFLMWVVTGISTGLTQGFSIQLSQYYGAKDFENLRKSLAPGSSSRSQSPGPRRWPQQYQHQCRQSCRRHRCTQKA